MAVEVERRRLDEIQRYRVVADPAGRDVEALVALAARICEVPTAALSVVTPDHEHQVVAHGFDGRMVPREESLCALLLDEPQTVVLTDAGTDARFAGHPSVTGPTGEVRFYVSAPLRADSGVILGRLCLFADEPRELSPEQHAAVDVLAGRVVDALTLRVRTRELEVAGAELAATREELQRSSEHLTLFAGQVSHDLRTPLTAILANAEMLTSEPAVAEDADVQWMVDGIQRAGHRLDRMIEEMVAYARVGGRLSPAPTDLGAVATTVLTDLRPAVEATTARVTLGELPTVTCDATQIYEVLSNLIGNALKFAKPDEPPVVHVSAERLDGRWRISVADHGIGVPEDRREKMFVLFARVDKRVEGSGIGLASVQRTVQAHGGRVGMAETPGGGTTVWFELPV